jgi:predicted GIY-YIG superfamily endonuclease
MLDFYIYILKCNDGTYYIGHTDDLEKRIAEHQTGSYAGYTCQRLPIQLVFFESFASRVEALDAERKLKKWSKEKKEMLITKGWEGMASFKKRKRSYFIG